MVDGHAPPSNRTRAVAPPHQQSSPPPATPATPVGRAQYPCGVRGAGPAGLVVSSLSDAVSVWIGPRRTAGPIIVRARPCGGSSRSPVPPPPTPVFRFHVVRIDGRARRFIAKTKIPKRFSDLRTVLGVKTFLRIIRRKCTENVFERFPPLLRIRTHVFTHRRRRPADFVLGIRTD